MSSSPAHAIEDEAQLGQQPWGSGPADTPSTEEAEPRYSVEDETGLPVTPADSLPWRRSDEESDKLQAQEERRKKYGKREDKSKLKERMPSSNERTSSKERPSFNEKKLSSSKPRSQGKRKHKRRENSLSPSKSSRKPKDPAADSAKLPWRQASMEGDVAVPSPSVKGGSMVDADRPSSRRSRLGEAESRHSERINMNPMIDPDAEPREILGPRDHALEALDNDADSVDSSQRVQQWLESSEETSLDPDLDDEELYTNWELRGDGHSDVQGTVHDATAC